VEVVVVRRVEIRRPQDVGLALSEARHAAGLTQAQLSEDCGVERTYLAKLESGASTLLLSRLLRLLRRLDARLVVELTDGSDSDGTDGKATGRERHHEPGT
jgi:transcriptional regulator with XRE-family HTH domain